MIFLVRAAAASHHAQCLARNGYFSWTLNLEMLTKWHVLLQQRPDSFAPHKSRRERRSSG